MSTPLVWHHAAAMYATAGSLVVIMVLQLWTAHRRSVDATDDDAGSEHVFIVASAAGIVAAWIASANHVVHGDLGHDVVLNSFEPPDLLKELCDQVLHSFHIGVYGA